MDGKRSALLLQLLRVGLELLVVAPLADSERADPEKPAHCRTRIVPHEDILQPTGKQVEHR